MLAAMQSGYRIGHYEIHRVLRRDAVGVEYEAVDSRADERVLMKEYCPEALANRRDSGEVGPRSQADRTLYHGGLDRFLAHYQTLGRLDHGAIVKIRGHQRANGTGYAVMECPAGTTLAARLEDEGRLSESALTSVFRSLLDGVETAHRANVLHGEINPENIAIRPDGSAVLVGFGSPSQSVAGPRSAFRPASQGFAGLLTPGYAALEQYSLAGRLGFWTDIYALGAVMYRCATGITPQDAPARAAHDDLLAAVLAAKGSYDRQLLSGIDAALALRIDTRPASVAVWRRRIPSLATTDGRRPVAGARLGARQLRPVDSTVSAPAPSASVVRLPTVSARPAFEKTLEKSESERPEAPSRGLNWVVPALAATGLIVLLTWLDTGILRATGAGEQASSSPAQRPVAAMDEPGVHALPAVDSLADSDESESRVGLFEDPVVRTDTSEDAVPLLASVQARGPEREVAESLPMVSFSDERAVEEQPAIQSNEGPPFSVVTVPGHAEVRFAERQFGYAPEMLLPPGDYRVEVVLPGFVSWEGIVNHGSKPTRHHLVLQATMTEFSDALLSGGRGPTMLMIPPGAFQMGCLFGEGCFDNELPLRNVEIPRPIALSKYEITFGDYDRFTQVTSRRRAEVPDNWKRGQWPVVNVSWNDAAAYAAWLSAETGRNYRLPTESEWEYAARAKTESAYSWGDEPGDSLANCAGCRLGEALDSTVSVGSFAANSWGLHDVHGNVWEWVANCGDRSLTDDCQSRVRRGGSWVHSPQRMRSASRVVTTSELRSLDTGFRVLLQIE